MTFITDQPAREQALDPRHSFIVQAPAGSGKTELLTQRFLVLLASVQKPEEIMAITFTRKAAAQMRQRIIQALLNAKLPEPEAAHAKLTWNLARKALERSALLGWDLLDNPNRLQIQTIDSLCAMITRQMPILARFGAQPSISDDPSALYAAAAREVINGIHSDSGWQAPLKEVLLHLDNQFSRVESLFVSMLSCRDQWLPHIVSARRQTDLRQYLEAALREIVQESLDPLPELLSTQWQNELLVLARYAGHNLDSERKESPITQFIGLSHFPQNTVDDLPLWQALGELLLTKNNTWRKRIDKSIGFPAPSNATNQDEKAIYKDYKDRMATLLTQLQDQSRLQTQLSLVKRCPPPQYTEQQWQIIQALLTLLPILTAQLKVSFTQLAEVDFTEVAMAALQALGDEDEPTDIALGLDHRIQHLLIDEFQDTSIAQFRLLEKLTAGWQDDDGRSLFLVGDPMQSIYRFRQAEVGLFLRAQEFGLTTRELTPLHLHTNFRSDPAIVHWINEKFSQIFPQYADFHNGAVPYSPADSFHSDNKRSIVECHCHVTRDEQAEKIIQIIQQTQKQAPHASIAILVKARNHLFELLPLLQEHQLSYQAVDIDPLSTRPVIQDLWALTRALLYPADRLAWFSVLRAPWCGLTLEDLHTIALAYPEGSLATFCYDDLELSLNEDSEMRAKRCLSIFKDCLDQRRRWALRDWVEQGWCRLGGPACYQAPQALNDADAFFDLLEKHEQGGDLADRVEFGTQLDRLFAASDPNSDPRLQIMTIHKSKGLEFDTVILPGLERGTRQNESPLLMWSERPTDNDQSDLVLAPIKASHANDDPVYAYLRYEESLKEEHELARLLYVAVTRAKTQLHCCFTPSFNQNLTMRDPVHGSLLAPLWPWIANEVVIPKIENADHNRSLAEPTQTLQRLSINWDHTMSFPGLAFRNLGANPNPEQGYRCESNFLRQVGTLTHRILQTIAEEGLDHWSSIKIETFENQWRQQLLSKGVLPNDLETAITLIQQAINGTLNDKHGRWILDSNHQQAASEAAYSAFIDGDLQNIIIDRTFIDEQGQRWIIDYKITQAENETETEFLAKQRQQYQKQLDNYAKLLQLQEQNPIHCGLYFPLTAAWTTWEFEE